MRTKTKPHSTTIGARWQAATTDPRLTSALEAFEAVAADTDAASACGRRLLVDGRVLIDLTDAAA